MSSASGEGNRWRNSNSHRQQPSRSGSGASTPSQSSTRQSINYSQAAANAVPVAAPPPTTNAWSDRSRSASAVRTPLQPQSQRPTAASPGPNGAPTTISANRQGAINYFNSGEVKEMFRRGYTKLAGPDVIKATYRRSGEAASKKTGNAWGSKPSNMANNGPDFFLQLRKLVDASTKGEHGRGG